MKILLKRSPVGQAKPDSSLPPQAGKLRLWPLVAATFLMVSGGTYGIEDVVHGAGYVRAILILLLTPLLWSLPTGLMLGELSSALPQDGGFYVWVRRAMGNCWGFQEAWLSLVASIFDMAIYPTLFLAYLTRLLPWFGVGYRGVIVGVVFIAVCAALNISGVHAVGATSFWVFLALSLPFVLIVLLAPIKYGALAHISAAPSTSQVGIVGGILVAMWNYMGWDNASTIAGEVERPQSTYPRALFVTVFLVAVSYLLPVIAVSATGLSPTAWETGSWADIAGLIGGPALRVGLVIGGMLSAFGMFNALVMSYSRLPYAMAIDGMLPRVFASRVARTQAPWVSILVLSTGWALCLGLGFERLVSVDVMIYGASLLLEFVALVFLRVREPNLPRPFKVPGGLWGAALLGVFPALLLSFSIVDSSRERIFGMNSLWFGAGLIVTGFAVYAINRLLCRRRMGRASESFADTSR